MTFDPRSVLFVCGLMYVAMALAVLVVLFQRHTRLNLVVWVGSGVCMGVAACLFAFRGVAPDWLSLAVANVLAFGNFALKTQALRLETGREARWGRALALWFMATGPALAAWWMNWPEPTRQLLVGLLMLCGASIVTFHAGRLARQLDSRGARLIALAFAVLALMILLRVVRSALGLTDSQPISSESDFLAAMGASILSALCGNVGYLGMALDRTHRNELAQRQALEALRDMQLVQQQSARARAAVRGERYRSSQVLAHEVRQPLHNAAVLLQAAVNALLPLPAASEARRAVGQAQAVIRRVTTSLDNTVAAASLLTGEDRVRRMDVDLAMLVDLCIADLLPDARARVKVEHRADARSALMELGLVRLAVRNLLTNATQYSPPDTPVILRLLDCDDPLALVIEVADGGPGLPVEVQATLGSPDASHSPHSMSPGDGLGLRIVRRVAALHGGSLAWRQNDPAGTVFRLSLPQAQPD